ncbi:hypothetical protein STENM36S_05662 [Streptomyces tendae]
MEYDPHIRPGSGHTGPIGLSPAAAPHALAEVMIRIRNAPRILTRRYRDRLARRDRSPSTTPELAGRSRPWTRAARLVAIVLLGAWLGLQVIGNVHRSGPWTRR